MPPRKRATTTKKKTTPKDSRVLVLSTEEVEATTLNPYYQNPRIGDVDTIAKSLHLNGQYKPIVVNIGTETGRPNEILAGNHTQLGARKELTFESNGVEYHKEPWDQILVSWVDVGEELARNINLVDNASAEKGDYDYDVLAEALRQAQESDTAIAALGYDEDEFNSILAKASQHDRSIDDFTANMPDSELPSFEEPRKKGQREEELDERSDERVEADQKRGATAVTPQSLEQDKEIESYKVQAELQALLEVKQEAEYMGDSNYWQIPDLREDMLLEDVPEDFIAWGGNEALQAMGDKADRWYLYNYGLGGPKNLPMDRAVLGFNTWDEKFENWWTLPAYYLSRLMSQGLDKAILPDFSFYDTTPRAMHLFGVYKSQWLGRFFQEAGCKVVPRLQFDTEQSFEFNTIGIPKGCPLLAISAQNFGDDKSEEKKIEKMVSDCITLGAKEIQPGKILLYGNQNRLERMASTVLAKNLPKTTIQVVPSYSDVRRRSGVFGKQSGLGAMSAKDKKRIKDEARAKFSGQGQDSAPDTADEHDDDE